MGDALGKIFVALIGCVLMFIMPVLLISLKQDTVSQSYIDNAVSEFVDNARATGKITPRLYEKLCDDVDRAHLLCKIEITHSSLYTVPTNVFDPVTGLYETEDYRNDYIKEDILNVMYPPSGDNVDYVLKNGDYLKVEVKNISPTFGIRLLGMFLRTGSDTSIVSSYGGYVGNTRQ